MSSVREVVVHVLCAVMYLMPGTWYQVPGINNGCYVLSAHLDYLSFC